MDLQDQPTHNFPSPTSSSAFLPITGFSVQFSCSDLLSDASTCQACFLFKFCILVAFMPWHVVLPKPHMAGYFSSFKTQLRCYLLLWEISNWKLTPFLLTIASHWFTVDLHYTVFVNSSTPLNLFVIPESILAALLRSFSDACRVAKISVTWAACSFWVGAALLCLLAFALIL